jgi:signal transduction histidine kinase
MTKKLLHKTSKSYLLLTSILLLISAPVFYFLIQNLYLEDVDEALELRKEEFLQYSVNQLKESDIPFWNAYNRDIKILKNPSIKNEIYFYKHYYDTLSQEMEPYRELNVPVMIQGKPYTLSVRANMVESEDLIFSIFSIFIFLLIFMLIGLFFINKRLSAKLWQPFYQIIEQIENFEVDKNRLPQLPDTDIEEFRKLNQSIEYLIQKNRAIYRNQREFVENAAHELQTPLAIFQSKIDTLMQTGGFSNHQNEILSSLNESVSRLNRLNKNLLLLSKIENENYDEKQTISINEIIEKQLDFFIGQAQSKNIRIQTDFSELLFVQANQSLTEILISNLFLNAIRHNVKNGQLLIKTSKDSLIFSNTGNAQALNKEKLFTRFSKLNPSAQGNGLGLAIVKKIADLNHWEIKYSFSENKHVFSVRC